MSNTNDLLNRINAKYSTMSKGHKLLATYITDNYDKAVFLTAAKMGETVGISESTVVRFATSLGYKGYPDFQKALEELVRNKLNSVQRMEVTYGRISQSQILETVLQSDRDKIKTTLEKIDADAFDLAVDTILQSRKIYIVGIRSCAPLASFLAFYMNLMFEDVCLLTTNSSSELFEQMVRIGKDDVIIGISFPRYSMRTLKALEFANNRNAKVITITDSIHSPMNLYSSCNLIADSDMASIVDSLVAPLSVINALIVALCMKKQSIVAKTLTELEDIWNEYQVYENDEIDYIDESEVLSPADDLYHIDKTQFDVPFVCGAKNLGEALRRIAEGASMIRSKGEPGTGDVIQAVRHLRSLKKEIARLKALRSDELYQAAKELQVPYDLVKEVHETEKLPVVLFAAGGVATPADAALMMQLGAEGVCVGSGIFKSGDPEKRARAIVQAVTNYQDKKLLAKLSENLGEAMVGINEEEIQLLMAERGI